VRAAQTCQTFWFTRQREKTCIAAEVVCDTYWRNVIYRIFWWDSG
jgi:hypothetical protein